MGNPHWGGSTLNYRKHINCYIKQNTIILMNAALPTPVARNENSYEGVSTKPVENKTQNKKHLTP